MSDSPEPTLPPAMLLPLEPGAMLGSFRLLSILGEGGMGRVYVAEDTRLGRKVALKVMMPHLAREERARKMFLREARSAAAVGHDRIVTIHEANEADGVPYIAMELLAGEPLDKYLARKSSVSLPVALAIAQQVAEGLDAAHSHEQKLIHRDVKPANVWLRSAPGRKGIDVRLLDFGLARAAGGDTLSVTSVGKAMGTPMYMAPEQWDGKGVDHQSDIFSLGVMLYEMLTGRMPFAGESIKELMFQICMPAVLPPPPAKLVPAISWELSGFVLRMLAKDKALRVASAAEVVRVLAKLRKAAGGSTAVSVVEPMPSVRTVVPRALSAEPMPPDWAVVPRVLDADTKPLFVDEQSTTATERAKSPRRRGIAVWLLVGVPLFLAAVAAGYFASVPRVETTGKHDAGGGVVPAAKLMVETPPTWRVNQPTPTRPSPIVDTPKTQKVRPPLLDCTGPSGASAAEVKQSQQAWAAYLGLPVEYPVDLGDGAIMVFVLIPPGKFLMGTTEEELDALVKLFPKMTRSSYLDETPQHAVTIARPMYVGKTEVTRGQFARFTPSGPMPGDLTPGPGEKPGIGPDDTHPVVNVSWNGAKIFAAAVGGRALPAGFGTCRLPREAEWEYACRAGTRSRYPNGADGPESLSAFANVPFGPSPKGSKAPVASLLANRFGLHDMIGNVWEWCEDGYEKDAYKSHGSLDPYIQPTDRNRVSRGGNWNCSPLAARSAYRFGILNASNGSFVDDMGCRLVLPQDGD